MNGFIFSDGMRPLKKLVVNFEVLSFAVVEVNVVLIGDEMSWGRERGVVASAEQRVEC